MLKHGDAKNNKESRLYTVWINMRQRCNNPNGSGYKDYGGRGIGICSDWDDYSKFKSWALANGYSNDLTIDRADNDGDYCPENCQWITKGDNTIKSKRKFTDGEVIEIRKIIRYGKYSMRKIARAYNVDKVTINKIAHNKTYKEAI